MRSHFSTIPPYEAFPQLDAGTHSGSVQALAMAPDGRTLLSAGETTVRVWDLASRRLKRMLLGRVDGANGGATGDRAASGKVLRMAVSPDGRWVAVVKPWWQGPTTDARSAHPLPGGAVAATPDWDVQRDGGGSPLDAADPPVGSGDGAPDIDPDEQDDFALQLAAAIVADRIVDAGLDNDGGWITELQVFELATGNLHGRTAFPGKLMDVAFSPDARWLVLATNGRPGPVARRGRAGGAGGQYGGRRQAELLAYDSRALLRRGAQPLTEPAWRLALGPICSIPTLPVRLCFVPADGDAGAPQTSRRRRAAASHGLVVAISDEASRCGHLFWLALSAAQGLTVTRTLRTEAPLSVATLAASPAVAAVAALPARGSRSARGQLLWFRHDAGASGTVDTEAPPVSLAFSPGGRRLAAGLRADPVGGEEPPHGTQTVQVSVYEVSPVAGPVLASSYYGHDASVRALAFVDAATLASAGGDSQAIHVWKPERRVAELAWAIRGTGRTMVMPGVTRDERVRFGTVPTRLLPPGAAVRQQTFDLRSLTLSSTTASHVRAGDAASRKWLVGDVDDVVLPLWFIGDCPRPMPPGLPTWPADLTLFVGADGEWVLLTASGHYACSSPEAARCIGYRINRGVGQEAQLIPSDRFKDFYRPDLVRAVVRHGTEARARAAGVVIPVVDVVQALPPIVEQRFGTRRQDDRVAFSFSVEAASRRALPTRFSLLRNNRVVWVGTPKRRQYQRCEVPALPLVPGINRFTFHAENAHARSVPLEIEVEGPAPLAPSDDGAVRGAPSRGHLYLLSVGVGRFVDERHMPLQFAAGDARAVHDAFTLGRIARGGRPAAALSRQRGEGNRAFGKVESQLLTDEQATKVAILDALDRMTAEIRARHAASGTERDVLFVFFSGHGMRVGAKDRPEHPPTLFFVNHDLIPTVDGIDGTGLSILDLGDRITSVPAEVVLVFDACHAGLAGGGVMQMLDPAELAHRVQAIYERGMYLMGAARAAEEAQEVNAQSGGVLTLSILRALEATHRSQRGAQRGAKALDVLMADLVAGVQRLVPEVGAAAGVPAQTPVCRTFGDLVPLTILKTGGPPQHRPGPRPAPAATPP